MMKILISVISILLVCNTVLSQKDTTQYHPPLDIPLILASNFGELRPNHFHMGLDFKTGGVTGKKLYAIKEGYVSRIKVSVYGYGRVIYIDHPNGVTSVYAHCRSFKGQIDSIVKAHQFLEENFEVEIFPKKNEIRVERGEVIALSGNSGSSQAPHLHFELRDTESEAAVNPLLYGFSIPDNQAPVIRNIKIYGITKSGYRIPKKSKVIRVYKGKTRYYVNSGIIEVPASYLSKNGGLGLAFDVIDRFDQAPNKCGLYASTLTINSDTIFGQKIDTIPFESTRYVNIHKDFREYSYNGRKFHKSFKTDQNDLPIYLNSNNGLITASPGDTLNVTFVAFDASNNKSLLKLKLKITDEPISSDYSQTADLIYPDSSLTMTGIANSVEIPSGCFYEPIHLQSKTIDSEVGKAATPIQKPYTISIAKDSTTNIGKHYIEIIANKGRKKTLTGQFYKGHLNFTSKYLGSYKLKIDTIPPTISSQSFTSGAQLSRNKTIKWRIKDSQTGIQEYDIYINGVWALLRYDYKTGYVYYTNNGRHKGKCEIEVIVKDNVGNQSTKKTTAILL